MMGEHLVQSLGQIETIGRLIGDDRRGTGTILAGDNGNVQGQRFEHGGRDTVRNRAAQMDITLRH
jgi:hypothetical protein